MAGRMKYATVAISAFSIWGSNRMRFTRSCCCCKSVFILCHRNSNRSSTSICCWYGGRGNMDRNDVWNGSTNHCTSIHHLENRLERRGEKGVKTSSSAFVKQSIRSNNLVKRVIFYWCSASRAVLMLNGFELCHI